DSVSTRIALGRAPDRNSLPGRRPLRPRWRPAGQVGQGSTCAGTRAQKWRPVPELCARVSYVTRERPKEELDAIYMAQRDERWVAVGRLIEAGAVGELLLTRIVVR